MLILIGHRPCDPCRYDYLPIEFSGNTSTQGGNQQEMKGFRMKKLANAALCVGTATLSLSAMGGTAQAVSSSSTATTAGVLNLCTQANFGDCVDAANSFDAAGRNFVTVSDARITNRQNDSISSIANFTGGSMCFWADPNFSGRSIRIGNGDSQPDLNNAGFPDASNPGSTWNPNDQISSWRPC